MRATPEDEPAGGWTCGVCALRSIPTRTAAEAAQLALVHDALLHGGRPTATPTPTLTVTAAADVTDHPAA